MPQPRQVFITLAMTQQMTPDNHYESTVDNLQAMWGAVADDAIWTLEAVPVNLIDRVQLIDDAGDEEGHNKVESMRKTMQAGGFIPPAYLIHEPGDRYAYTLIEGRHRYNAAHRDNADTLAAWVGHPDCECGAPRPAMP